MKDANGYGREVGITPEIVERLVDAFALGASIAHAARYAGVSPRTVSTWIANGRNGHADPIYAEVAEAIEVAQARGALHSLEVLAKSDDWRAHYKRLAFIDPQSYSERRILEGRIEHRLMIDPDRLSEDEFETLRALVKKAQPELPPAQPIDND